MDNILVIYHKNCWDGFCAAWLLHMVFGGAEFVAAQYGMEPPDCTGKDVWIVDFSYPRNQLMDIVEAAHSVRLLDHHQTAQAALAGFEDTARGAGFRRVWVTFDMSKSGGRLTLEHLVENAYLQPEVYPWLVDYTEDRDLWRWKLPQSQAINAAIRSYPLDFAMWDSMAARGALDGPWVNEGFAILRRERQIIADHVAHAYEVELAGHRVPCVNATTLFSDIAGELAVGKPFAAAFFIREDGKRQYSLRSDEQGLDVSSIAQQFGGGGHRHAAGFSMDAP